MGDINLKAALGGQIVLTPTNTASNYTATFPAITGVVAVQAAASYTAGSVLFANSSGQIAQDNSNFFWDDSNNRLGIGTASPAAKLGVSGNAIFSGTAPYIAFASDQSGSTPGYFQYTNSTNLMEIFSTGAVAFETGGNATPAMRLDASGNLGLGVSPSAWVTNKAFQLPSGSVSDNQSGILYYTQNGYFGSGGWTYSYTAAAAQYRQSSGQHQWFNAPSGTAGNPITFTQAMTLDASGTFRVKGAGTAGSTDAVQFNGGAPANSLILDANGRVGIGTSPSFPFQVSATGANSSYGIYFSTTSTTSTGSEGFYGIGYVTVQYVSTGTTSSMTHNLYQGYISPSNNATTTFSDIFTVNPATLGASPSGTISSLKTFNVGSTSYQHTGTASITITNTYGLYVNNQAGVTTGVTKTTAYGIYIASQTGATTNYGIYSAGGKIVMQGVYDNTAGTANVSVDASGNLTRITSSIKYKKDVVTYENGLNKVLSLRPVTYKSKCEADLDALYGGFIAEEVDTIGLEEFIERNADGEVEAVRYPNMVALMASAIQELSAKLDAAEARIAALEGAK